MITYEQPVNELIRALLRLEHLFNKIDYLLENNPEKHRNTLTTLIIMILNLLDRPDLKSKLNQELHRHINQLSRLSHSPDIRTEKLEDTLNKLQTALQYFSSLKGKIGQSLRDNEFLTNVRLHMNTPTTDACFETPSYFYWLNQPEAEGLILIRDWINELKLTRDTVNLFLHIVRHSAHEEAITAEQGFYYQAINTQSPCQLIRVSIPDDLALFPEISAGKHRLNIRFIIPNMNERNRQYEQDVPFELTMCCV